LHKDTPPIVGFAIMATVTLTLVIGVSHEITNKHNIVPDFKYGNGQRCHQWVTIAMTP